MSGARITPLLGVLILLAGWLAGCVAPFGLYHTVKKGETLHEIAERYGVPTETLREVNYLRDPGELRPGDQIFVPGVDGPKKGGRKKAAKEENGGKEAGKGEGMGRKAAGLDTRGRSRSGALFIWPVEGVLSSGFGMREGRMHTGIDISAPEGAPVKAAGDGRVIYADLKQRGLGNLVILEHGDGIFTVYAHNKQNLVREGDSVKQGQVIAKVGHTGQASGPHLHFEIRDHKKPVDPMAYLP